MESSQARASRGTCFVVMGFGKKTDFETGRTLDLDKSYRNVIKPAVEAAGLTCIRADEIVHSGLIDIPMYEQLLEADIVVADLSTFNRNALYELGVRHALRPYATVVIAEDGIKSFPFDINHVVVRQYRHLGEDIGYDEAVRFQKLLTDAINQVLRRTPPTRDSPVYSLIQGLTPPARAAALAQAEVQAQLTQPPAPEKQQAKDAAATHSVLMQEASTHMASGNFDAAKPLLKLALDRMTKGAPITPAITPDAVFVVQRLALATYKSKKPDEPTALEEAAALLKGLEPGTSNDTETLGLWGAVQKRLCELTGRDRPALDEAIRSYERGFYLRNDYYNGINFAYLLNLRARTSEIAEAIADFVRARRVREEVAQICRQWLETTPPPTAGGQQALEHYTNSRYWVLGTLAEALLGLDDPSYQQALDEALSLPVASWMKSSTQEQLARLSQMLKDSPLKHIRAPGG
jgi:tetratricopeptide (TPR) repeat protein